MAHTKKEFFSLHVDERIIPWQITLWNTYCEAKNDSNFLTSPTQGTLPTIHFYEENNAQVFSPLLSLISQTLQKQGEAFSPFNFASNSYFKEQIACAFTWLTRQNKAMDAAMHSFIARIIVVDCPDFIACSSIKFMGTVVIAPKSGWCFAHYVENLVHEMSHIDLYTRQILDPLIEKNVMLASPFRKNKRPTIAVFHAAFVLSRVVSVLIDLYQHPVYKQQESYQQLCANYQKLVEALQTLQYAPHLTMMGKLLHDEMHDNLITLQKTIKHIKQLH